jgi:UDP-perosamine 4-acetyltransferase
MGEMSIRIVIIGAGGLGRVVLDAVRLLGGRFDPAGFIDADTGRLGQQVLGLPILGGIHMLDKLRRQEIAGAIVAIGDNRVRAAYADHVRQAGLEPITVIHPAAAVSALASIGSNVYIGPMAVVGTEARVGDDVIISAGAIIEHECRIGRAAHIGPATAIAGRAEIGEGAVLGLGCRIGACMKVGRRVVVRAGAVVMEDLPDE